MSPSISPDKTQRTNKKNFGRVPYAREYNDILNMVNTVRIGYGIVFLFKV